MKTRCSCVSAALRRGYNSKNVSELVFVFYEKKNYRNNIEWLYMFGDFLLFLIAKIEYCELCQLNWNLVRKLFNYLSLCIVFYIMLSFFIIIGLLAKWIHILLK